MIAPTIERLVARLHGDAPLTFLHAVLSQDVASLPAGRAAIGCYLDANAHVLAEIRVLHLPGDVVMFDAEPAAAPAFETLSSIAGLSGCEISFEPWTFSPERGPTDLAEHEIRVTDRGIEVGVAWGGPGTDVLTPGASPIVDAAGFEAARIEAGRPRFGVDITEDLYVFETPLLARAVSFTKGCYPGQESVARTVNLGAPKRKLARITFPSGAPSAGAELDGMGRITSSAGAYAIALVKAEVEDGPLPSGAVLEALV